MPDAHHHANWGGELAKAFKASVVIIAAAAAIVLTVLLVRSLVRRFSRRLLCHGCNRYYSARLEGCPFCGMSSEQRGRKGAPR